MTKMHPKKKQAMPLLFVPHQFSVVIGKGRDARDAPGTRFLRAEIQSKLHLYKTCTGRLERAQIVSDLLTEQQRRCPQGGVFVKFDGDRWWELSEHDARENITAAFRNRLHEKYTSSSKFKSAKRRMQLKTSSAAQQESKNNKDDQTEDDSAVALLPLVQAEQGEQTLVRGMVQQGMRMSGARSNEVAPSSTDDEDPWKRRSQSPWLYDPKNKIDAEDPRPVCRSRTTLYYEENKEAVIEDDGRQISGKISKTKAARMLMAPSTRPSRLVGFLPPLITTVNRSTNDHDVLVKKEHDHPQEDGWTTIPSSSSSSSSTDHDEENDSLHSHTSIASSTSSSKHDICAPFLPRISSSAISTPISGTKFHHDVHPTTTTTLVVGGAADLATGSRAELTLWASYLPPVLMVWNDGVKSRWSPGGEEGTRTGRGIIPVAYMVDDTTSHEWNQFQVDALLEPVNPSIFEE